MPSSYLPVSTKDTDSSIPLTTTPSTTSNHNVSPAHLATTTLRVEGMTCGACTSAIESAFRDTAGFGTISVSLVMGRAVVTHDPNRLPTDRIKEMIEDRGFDAEVLSTDLPPAVRTDDDDDADDDDDVSSRESRSISGSASNIESTTTLAVEGMTCGACTSAIESGFKDLQGVKSFTLSLLSERAVVVHDPTVFSADQAVQVIEDRGFDATILDTKESRPDGLGKRRNPKRRRVIATTTISVEGMTCGACTSAVENGFEGVDGVINFNISLLAERAVIVHDTSKLSVESVQSLVEDRGFDARVLSTVVHDSQPSSTQSTIQFKIYGLTDSSSSTRLETILRGLPRVSSAIVNLHTSRALIVYDPAATGLRALVEAIEAAGFNALVADSDDNNAQLESLAKTREIQEWRRSFRLSLGFAIPVFLISMVIPMLFPDCDIGAIPLVPAGLYVGDMLCLILTIPVQFGIGKKFYVSAFKSLRHGSPTMDVLVVLGTSAAFFFSVAAMLVSILIEPHSRPATVFDTSTMLITFITLGRYLENRAKGQTSKALSRLMSLAPSSATIYTDPIAAEKAAEDWDSPLSPTIEKQKAPEQRPLNPVLERTIPTELIQVGDIVVLRPGDKIPADGTVTRGESYMDESMVTGEAMPILKRKGGFLIGGTVNGTGRLDFRVTRAGRDTQLSQIVKMVQEAQTSRAPIQRMADIVAGYFVPSVITLGVVTFLGWMVLSHVLTNPPKMFTAEDSGGRFMVCLKLCISVIVFACPCALGLSTPTAVMVGTGVGAEKGILVKGGAALESATRITHIVLDKTGTLTMGKMSVADILLEPSWCDGNEWRRRLWWTLVGLTEMSSEHPIGKAILAGAKAELGIDSDAVLDGRADNFEATVGRGISASVEPSTSAGRQRYSVLVGNAAYLRARGIAIPATADPESAESSSSVADKSSQGYTTIFVAIDSVYSGRLSLTDTLKPTAPATIVALHAMGISTSIVTGDQESAALSVAAQVCIPPSAVHAGVSPEEKQTIIRDLQASGEVVAMVGDGINDSPALATADVGIAMSSGTDVAVEAADIVLMRPDDLLSIPASLHLARTIFNRIKLNLIWACAYNIIGLPFAMGFFIPLGVHLHPMAAGAAMAASSVSVVSSSLLLKFWKQPSWMSMERLGGQKPGVVRKRGRGWGLFGFVAEAGRGIFRKRIRKGEGYVPLQNVEGVV
ncbi:MAG: hypothetical protein M1825_000445 [Sarcosagium campestre]|nr:MAG: hypothetical protein M1825_000445 [Sarcosagium campestre]